MDPKLIPEMYCTDFAASVAFYTGVLGFAVLYRRDAEGFAMLERQGARVMLEDVATGRKWITAPLVPPFGRGVSFQIETDHVDMLYAQVQAAGAHVFLPLEDKWYGTDTGPMGNRQFIVQDPDGFLLRFFQDLGPQAGPAS